MTDEPEKTIKDAEEELAETQEKADDLEDRIKAAETKHRPPIDHANDGGVI